MIVTCSPFVMSRIACRRHSRCHKRGAVSVTAKVCTPPKRKTGGGGGDGDSNRDSNRGDDQNAEQRARTYNIGVLQRAFTASNIITPKTLHSAMILRWGRPQRCLLVSENNVIAVKILSDAYHIYDEDDDIYLIAEVLNTYNLGAQFVDHIKYDHSIKDPRYHNEFTIQLNIPLIGARTKEWF